MPYIYSDQTREDDDYVLPNIEIFQLTASEVAETMEDELHEFSRRHEFRLAGMNSRARAQMIDAMIEELGIVGGWFYQACFPGCLPDGEPFGPFATFDDAKEDAIVSYADNGM